MRLASLLHAMLNTSAWKAPPRAYEASTPHSVAGDSSAKRRFIAAPARRMNAGSACPASAMLHSSSATKAGLRSPTAGPRRAAAAANTAGA